MVLNNNFCNNKIYDNNGCDMHMHTLYSDGRLKVDDIVKMAYENGLEKIAITDHDMTIGVKEAQDANIINGYGLTIIPAVEVSTNGYHILGYNVDIENGELRDLLKITRKCTELRSRMHCRKLGDYGFDVSFDEVRKINPLSKRITRYHIARYMLPIYQNILAPKLASENKEYTVSNLLRTYVSDEKLGKLPDLLPDAKVAIDTIHEAGGIAIIAHPFKDVEDMSELDVLVQKGIDGIEVQPNYTSRNIPFIEYANNHGLITTFGSDYHGPDLSHRPMLKGNRKIEQLLELV